MDPELQRLRAAVDIRRTFAIISHPDAGKTTLTEKLLLYGGAVHLAGSVKQKAAGGRQTTSDWMEIERQRGISISPSVLQFTYAGRHVNLLTFERSESGARRAPMTETEMDDPMVAETIGETAKARMVEELALLESAGNPFALNVFRQGQVTPDIFGSAMNSFGVEPYLDRFVE